ncbi:MAG TPA: exosortase/archaeosortase family protein [Candidatus Thermoplasmatota archaeon]|nr:exosortase/archaeosortase family protein [Candidatus Thermoplasmatota archaeon]
MNATLARLLGLLGLASLGEGLFILFRVVPHESPLLGAALAALGATLLYFAPLPRIERLPRWPLVVGGLGVAIGVVAWNLARGATFVPPKVALVAFGLLTAAAAPLATRPRVAHAVAWGIPLVGAPLFVWAAQAFAKASFAGATPMELFIEHALIAPMAGALAWMGYQPVVDGQYVTFDTATGGRLRLLVGVACSGIQAMGMFGGILLVYVLAEKPGWTKGILWSIVGLAGVYAANVVRLVALALVGSAHGSDALEWAHANLGWMFFVGWTGIFAWLTMGRPRRRARSAAPA